MTQSPTEALLPCPFCGGTTIHMSPPTCKRTDKYDPADRGFPIVHCGDCGVEANGKNWDESGASAIAAWNRRAHPQQPSGWRDIASAPKDGTYILLTNAESGGSWVGHFQQFSPSGFRFDNPWHSMMLNHWHLPNKSASSTPTHWQPLPPPSGAHPAEQQEGGDAPTCNVGHAHFTPFYLLSNARRICADDYSTKPNWVIARELFALGSNSAIKVCRDAGIDPDAFEVRRAAMTGGSNAQ